jgi:hypothetical protein
MNSLSAEDKEFLIRALGMHAALTRSFGTIDPVRDASVSTKLIAAWANGEDLANLDLASDRPLPESPPAAGPSSPSRQST